MAAKIQNENNWCSFGGLGTRGFLREEPRSAKREAVKREKIDKRRENLWLPATVDWSYRANRFEPSRCDPASWLEEPYRCVVIDCLLIDLVMLIDSYRSMTHRPLPEVFSRRFFLSFVSSLRGERKPLGPGYCFGGHVEMGKACRKIRRNLHFPRKASSNNFGPKSELNTCWIAANSTPFLLLLAAVPNEPHGKYFASIRKIAKGAFFWDYSGTRLHGREARCVLLGNIPIPEWTEYYSSHSASEGEWTESFWKRFIRVFSFWNSPKRMHPVSYKWLTWHSMGTNYDLPNSSWAPSRTCLARLRSAPISVSMAADTITNSSTASSRLSSSSSMVLNISWTKTVGEKWGKESVNIVERMTLSLCQTDVRRG